jgi:putative transposase
MLSGLVRPPAPRPFGRDKTSSLARHPEPSNSFRWFDSWPEVIQMVVMLYVRFPLSLRNVEDLAFERGIDICHETVRLWMNRFGPMFASKIRSQRV